MTGRPLPALIALIERALDDLPAPDLTRAAHDAEITDALLAETLDGTNNGTAHEALTASVHGQRHLEAARVLLEIVRAELSAYLHDLTGSESPRITGSQDETIPEQAAPGPMPRWNYAPGVQQKTHGRWVDTRGNVHMLLSGRHDAAFQAANEKAKKLGLIKSTGNRIFSAAADVELKFAVTMKPGQRAVIVINNPRGPCKGDYGCRKQLPAFLPEKAELTVYWPGGHQTFYGGTANP